MGRFLGFKRTDCVALCLGCVCCRKQSDMTARLECNGTGSEAGREENFPNGFPNRIPNRFNAEQALFETLYRNRPSLLIGNTLCGLLMAIIGWFDGYAQI